ncbi:Uncharacterised protein [Mycobacteroides abscessus]|nr:Uncharacterised protein [Mycobacteroides abscessus]
MTITGIGTSEPSGLHAVASSEQVVLEIGKTLCRRVGQVEFVRLERAEHDDLLLGACHRDVEATLATGSAQRSPVQRDLAAGILRKGEREEDDVALVTLHILEILDEELLLLASQGDLDEGVALSDLLEEVEDQLALLGVEGDDPDAPSSVLDEETLHFGNDGGGLGPVDACGATAAALPVTSDAVELESWRTARRHRRRGKAREPTLVIVAVGERDERLVLGAVVPAQQQSRQP